MRIPYPHPPPPRGFHHISAADVVWIFLGRNIFELRPFLHLATKSSLSKSSYNAVILQAILSTKDRNKPKSRHVSPRHNSVGCVHNFPADTRALSQISEMLYKQLRLRHQRLRRDYNFLSFLPEKGFTFRHCNFLKYTKESYDAHKAQGNDF